MNTTDKSTAKKCTIREGIIMGRKKIEKLPINRIILNEALKKRNPSINKLTNDENEHFIGVSRKTINRVLPRLNEHLFCTLKACGNHLFTM